MADEEGPRYLSDTEIEALASTMRVADPNEDNGAFSSITKLEALMWLRLLGPKDLSPTKAASASDENIFHRLRYALWDSQRIDYLFHGKRFSESPSLDVKSLSSWPDWQKEHAELRTLSRGMQKMDGYKDADRLNSYVHRHFTMSAFTQMENMSGVVMNHPKDWRGAWIGTKAKMHCAALDITREGGRNTPFVTYFTTPENGTCMLIMEILDVKECAWPEPSKKGGSQFTLHLEGRLAKSMKGASKRAVREKLQWHLQTGEEMEPTHIRMFARLLSHNATLIDPEYVGELQSHWAGVARDSLSMLLIVLHANYKNNHFKVANQSSDCNKRDWSEHKANCKVSKRLLSDPSSFPTDKFYVPIRTYVDFIPESGFAVEQEAIKESGSSNIGDCPRNEYGRERFIIRTVMPLDYSHNGRYKGATIFLWDRRRSLLARTSPGDPPMAKERNWDFEIPFHPQGYEQYKKSCGYTPTRGSVLGMNAFASSSDIQSVAQLYLGATFVRRKPVVPHWDRSGISIYVAFRIILF
ncbi:uncharacterized protein LACBIDRAFT_321809 [Laccaria bicolor S238N-H82]|uniref:Predicted protein n=1 Tax=Laccaria bicolor (strain S238N-H82 / ATCC MYA-4686) TaxID=486041 RepID=B0CU85_LACBS|nr:uncharacterized protein LACBIDRAFT_321809 [Laccaria bicolor S238N-H82]EDR14051.1 predicted protein [Laccaria bicolor S238N-H82]|eukprot:XP_001874610.1 predicted protein [Laccaria bicolor S238N-H82]